MNRQSESSSSYTINKSTTFLSYRCRVTTMSQLRVGRIKYHYAQRDPEPTFDGFKSIVCLMRGSELDH